MAARKIASSLLILALSCTPQSGVDMILHSGIILSMDRYMPPAEAVAIVDGRILAVGRNEEIFPLGNLKTRKIDLKGATVLPGLTDSHFHLLGVGGALENLDLVGTQSAQEVALMVGDLAASLPAGTWLNGRGWDQNDWEVTTFPDRALLDAVAPNHPVALRRVDGHALWVNSLALEMAGITAATPEPDGGFIHRRADGQPTGILIDNARNPVKDIIPELSTVDIRRRLTAAVARSNQVGLTAIHDPGVGQATLDVLMQMAAEGVLTLRYYGMLDARDPELLDRYFSRGAIIDYHDRVTVRAVKIYSDGAMGSRGAALLSPYSDDPGNRGLFRTSRKSMERLIARTLAAGFQPAVHALGDRAVRTVLDIYAQLLPKNKDHDLRPRIEHAQLVSRRDMRRFGELGVIAAIQPTHATSDMYWVEDRLGTRRMRGAYAWNSLLEAGAHIASGSDAPVEGVEPLKQIFAARTRQDTTGWPPGGWYPKETMSALAAARAMTTWAAYAAFQDTVRGKILPGYDADLTVLTHNPVGGEPADILETQVLMTILGGEIVWNNRPAWKMMPLPARPKKNSLAGIETQPANSASAP